MVVSGNSQWFPENLGLLRPAASPVILGISILLLEQVGVGEIGSFLSLSYKFALMTVKEG